jgi:hypothetical protein
MELNDVNIAPVVTESGVVEAAPTIVEGQVTTDTGEQTTGDVTQQAAAAPAEQQVEQKGPVPYDRFSAVNTQKNTLADENARLQEHIELLSKQQPPQQPVQQQQAQQGLTLQVMEQMGIDKDYATPEQMAQVIDRVSEIRTNQTTQENQTNQFMTAHPDFALVVGTNHPQTGQFVAAPPLLRAMQQNPQLVTDLQNAGAGAKRLAYSIAINDPTYQQQLAEAAKPVPQVQAESAEAAINNANSMTSISAVGTGAALDKVAQIRAMSDEEFEAHKQAIIQQGGTPGY